MSDLDERLAQLRARKASALTEGTDELARLKLELDKACSATKHDMDQAMSVIQAQILAAESTLSALDNAHRRLAGAVAGESHRITMLWRGVGIAVAILVFISAMTIGISWMVGRNLIKDARSEAEEIHAGNAEAVALARAEGEAAIAALAGQLAEQEVQLSNEIIELGAELAQLSADRDTARADLEHFAELKSQIGFDLVPYRKRVLIVLPEGAEITRWNAPGLSNLASYNGRMFRVVVPEG